MKSYTRFVKKAVALGADDACVIDAGSIATAPWVRWKCKYGCDGYDSSLCCPPNTPDYRETRELVDSYEKALLVHVTDDIRRMKKLTDIVTTLERDIFLAGYYKAFALGAGPCNLCAECSMGTCRNPAKARPSLESCGVDVYKTARDNGYKIEVLKDMSGQMNRFAIVLIE